MKQSDKQKTYPADIQRGIVELYKSTKRQIGKMDGIVQILAIVVLVFGVLQIILFFKIWGMTNNVAAIRRIMEGGESEARKEDETVTGKIFVGAIVVRKSTGEQLKVTAVEDDGKFVCAKAGIEIGSFSADELCTWHDWLRENS